MNLAAEADQAAVGEIDRTTQRLFSQSYLKSILHYDKDTGIFTWKKLAPCIHNVKVGDAAGFRKEGYIVICINKLNYRAGRLAWLYVNGVWPTSEIDHKNTIKDDNRWTNLRDGTRSFNMQNQRRAMLSNKSTGVLGVYPEGSRFRAIITINKNSRRLGTYDSKEEAHRAYVTAKREIHAGGTL